MTKLTRAQRRALVELDARGRLQRSGGFYSEHSASVIRALERKGYVAVREFDADGVDCVYVSDAGRAALKEI